MTDKLEDGEGAPPTDDPVEVIEAEIEFIDTKMVEAFKDAAGDRSEITLSDGQLVSRRGRNVLVAGKPATWLEPDEREALLAELGRIATAAYLDPARNPLIRTSD